MPSAPRQPRRRLLHVATLVMSVALILPARAAAHGPFSGITDLELVLGLLFVFGIGPTIAGFAQRRSRNLRLGAVLLGIVVGTLAGAVSAAIVMRWAAKLDAGWAVPALAFGFLGGIALSCVLTINAAVWLARGE